MIESSTTNGWARRYSQKAFLGLWVGLFALQPSCKAKHGQDEGIHMIRVFYVPIGAQTLTAITSGNIEERGDQCVIDDPRDVEKIKKILSSGAPPSPAGEGFTDTGVRVKAIEVTKQGSALLAFVENEGYVKRADGRDQVLAPKDLATLKKLIEGHCKPAR